MFLSKKSYGILTEGRMNNSEALKVQRELVARRKEYRSPLNKRRMIRFIGRVLSWSIETKLISFFLRYQRTEEKVLEKYDKKAGAYVSEYNKLQSENKKILAVYDHVIQFVPGKELLEKRNQFIIDDIMRPLGLNDLSLLDVGAGELTTLTQIAKGLTEAKSVSALELSWSRIAVGRRFAQSQGLEPVQLVVGTATHLPFADNSFDIVFTSHCIEQANLDKWQILFELHRVARLYVVMLEPSWELGDKYQKRRIDAKGYLRGLDVVIYKMGYNLIRHELLPYSNSPDNRTAVYVIKKDSSTNKTNDLQVLACPCCKTATIKHGDFEFCMPCGRVYPIISGIPCMHPTNGVLASKYEELCFLCDQ